jgi:hypothetical protein
MLFEGSGKFVDVGQIRAGELGLGTILWQLLLLPSRTPKAEPISGVEMLGVFVCCAVSSSMHSPSTLYADRRCS